MTVTPAVVTGQPAQIADSRAMLLPVAPSGMPQPMIDVFHFGRIDPGLGDGVLDGVAAHHRAVGLVEAAAHRLGEPGARRRNDDGLFHIILRKERAGLRDVSAAAAPPPAPDNAR